MGLQQYRKMRDFSKTSEPQKGRSSKKAPLFVVQEHWASHHHFDFRLEAFGTLKSWAVPKGPSTKVGDKRLAVEVEDHPINYAQFKGDIPDGHYGAGHVEIWDKGIWVPPSQLRAHLEKGHLEFELKGKKLNGRWLLQRTNKTTGSKNQWLLIKRTDAPAITARKPRPKGKKARVGIDTWPESISPQLALLSETVPKGTQWLHELKFDGYRTIAFFDGKSVKLQTRNGFDWTKKYGALANEFKKLELQNFIIDGEIVVLDKKKLSNFSSLQRALSNDDTTSLKFYAFDLLYLNGHDLRNISLESRKELLKKMFDNIGSDRLLYSEHSVGEGSSLFKEACARGAEGIVSKLKAGHYLAGRSDQWQKIKCSLRQEFVIGGYTNPEGARTGFGALLMGTYIQKKFTYIGRVGSGFSARLLSDLKQELLDLEVSKTPFQKNSPRSTASVHWVKPKLVAEIEFKTWTSEGVLRQASFQGLREDKKAHAIHLDFFPLTEKIKSTEEPSFKLTHPERILYPETQTTKLDVANYYRSVAPWLLAQIRERPLSLLRCPEQAGNHCFFQKHLDASSMDAVKEVVYEKQKAIFIDSEEGLLQLIQWGVLEIHPWGCHQEEIMHPDQLIFDLDPDTSLPWKAVVSAALQLKDLLEQLSLTSFVKTTGGKGLHLHVPIASIYNWEQAKAFTKTVAQHLALKHPKVFTTNISKKARPDKIFIDYLRNGFGATAVAPYSLRSKTLPLVAVPISWTELRKLRGPDRFDINSTLKRLAAQKIDPWEGAADLKQKLKLLDR